MKIAPKFRMKKLKIELASGKNCLASGSFG